MVSAFQKLQLAGLGGSRMELRAALEIDEPVTGPGKDQKWNLDVSREPQVFCGGALPLGVEPARDLAVNQGIGAVSGDHFRDTRHGPGIDLVVQGKPGRNAGHHLAERSLPRGDFGFELERWAGEHKPLCFCQPA